MDNSSFINDLNLRWEELIERKSKEPEEKTIAIAADNIFWFTCNQNHNFGIIIKSNKKIIIDTFKLNDFKCLNILSTDNSITINLKNNQFNSHFKNLINFIINKIYINRLKDKDFIKSFFEEIYSAKDLLASSHLPNELGPEKVIGLYGELYFLLIELNKKFNINDCILYWTGPNKKHDFTCIKSLVEIKTTINKDNNKIQTSSSDQLSPIYEKKLFLSFFKFQKNLKGKNLNEIVKKIKDKLIIDENSINEFNLKLIKVGYFDEHKEFYNQKLSLLEEKFYYVDNKFPHIRKKDIITHDAIENIELKYKIDLEKCKSSKIEKNYLIERL